jgi:hypothetical protein
MKTPVRALLWEVVWKNRVIYPALLVLLAFGAVSAFLLSGAQPQDTWANQLRGAAFFAFLASLLLGYAPFTLMESNAGWRMNSMTTRWFIRPLRTSALVMIPLVLACGFIILLVGAWAPWLHWIARELDLVYMGLVSIWGVVMLQALAWTIPRKPSQYWVLAALIFLMVLFLMVGPQDQPRWEARRGWWLNVLAGSTLVPAVYSFYAAARNRRGDWLGEIPSFRSWFWYGGSRGRMWSLKTPTSALFWSDARPLLRAFGWSWTGMVLLLAGWVWFSLSMRNANVRWDWRLVSFAALDLLPPMLVLWMAGCGLYAGGEPNAGFHTQLSSFRGTHPVTAGGLAGVRIAPLFVAWLLAWLLLLVITPWYNGELKGIPERSAQEMLLNLRVALAWKMAISAHVGVGALPLFLAGRLQGFPNLLVVALLSWAWTWVLMIFLNVEGDPGWRWGVLLMLLGLKLAVAASALVRGCRTAQITWRFAACLLTGWLIIATVVIYVLPVYASGGAWAASGLALTLPLARLAACPLAMAANRHR